MTKARIGLPHLKDLSDEDFNNLIIEGFVHLDSVTEKTDGAAFVFHYDNLGFGTQSSGSGQEIMRVPQDYMRRATRNGKTTIAKSVPAFMRFHYELMGNKAFLDVMKEAKIIRGEVFLKDLCRPSHYENESIIVGTSYRNEVIGSNGTFIIHTQLSENKSVPLERLLSLSSCTIKFDHDIVDISEKIKVSNREETLISIETLLLETLNPKWGSETEGYIVHPSPNNQLAPRFKVISNTWKQYQKAAPRFKGITIK